MASIFEQALGSDFHSLHPILQKRFGVDTEAGYACVGRGIFAEVRRGAWWTCLLYTSPSPRDLSTSRMPSSA